MGAEMVLKPTKWFSNKALRLSTLSLHRRSPKSGSSASSSGGSSPASSPSAPQSQGGGGGGGAGAGAGRKEEELKQVFRHFDSDGDGKISALELRAYFGSIQEYMSHDEAQAAINDLDTDGDNLLDFHDFLKLMQREDDVDGEGKRDDLRRAFEMFELEKGCGCITPKGLQRMFHRLGDAKSYDECVTMIRVFDADGDGVLDFQEFHQMMA